MLAAGGGGDAAAAGPALLQPVKCYILLQVRPVLVQPAQDFKDEKRDELNVQCQC